MARLKYVNFAVDASGNTLSGAQVEVRDTAGSLVTLYEASTGSTQAYSGSNPFSAGTGTPDKVGYFEFWVEEPLDALITVGTGASAVEYPVYFGDDSLTINPATFSGDGSTVDFVLPFSAAAPNGVNIFIDGIHQAASTYSVSSATITFSEAPPVGTDNIEVRYSVVESAFVIPEIAVAEEFETVSALLATTKGYADFTVGSYLRVVDGNHTYKVAASGATNEHLTTTVGGSLKLYIVKDAFGFNVRAAGAVGDGTTDDNAAIQIALDAAYADAQASGATSTSYVPPSADGEYIFTDLDVKTDVWFVGTGGRLKLKDNTCTDAGTAYYPISNLGHSRSRFIDLDIDGNKANNTLFTVADAITCGGDRSRVMGCNIINPPDSGIMFSTAPSSICADNYIDGAPDVCIYVNGLSSGDSVIGSRVTGNICKNGTAGGIAAKRGSLNVIISGNTVQDCGSGITLEEVSPDGTPDKVSITNNLIKDILTGSGYGIDIGDSTACVVTGNHIQNCYGLCIYVNGAVGATISGNYVEGAATNAGGTYGNVGLLVDGAASNLAISGNVFTGMDEEGIYLVSCSLLTITGNQSYGNGKEAYRDTNSTVTDCVIQGNLFDRSSGSVTLAFGGNDNVFFHNKNPKGTDVAANGYFRNISLTTPVSNITPSFAGQIIHLTASGGSIWFATGNTDTAWLQLA